MVTSTLISSAAMCFKENLYSNNRKGHVMIMLCNFVCSKSFYKNYDFWCSYEKIHTHSIINSSTSIRTVTSKSLPTEIIWKGLELKLNVKELFGSSLQLAQYIFLEKKNWCFYQYYLQEVHGEIMLFNAWSNVTCQMLFNYKHLRF
jgi:hypothetical protein